MPLRPAEANDLEAIAEICRTAFFEEDLFGRTMHPRRHEFPDDLIIFWRQLFLDHWKDPRNRTVVTYTTEAGNESQEKITGVALWQRQGEGGGNFTKQIDIDALPVSVHSTHNTPTNQINRAIDQTKATILHDSDPWSAHHWHGARKENWYLSLIGIDPTYQGHGLGRELVAWGFEQADAENVHASVTSSEGNQHFYLRCGFDEIVGNACVGEGNPLHEAGVRGGDILFRFPKGGKGEKIS